MNEKEVWDIIYKSFRDFWKIESLPEPRAGQILGAIVAPKRQILEDLAKFLEAKKQTQERN